jgi:hypothetical protein
MSDNRSAAISELLRAECSAKKIAILRLARRPVVVLAGLVLFAGLPRIAVSQRVASADSVANRDNYWRNLALGFGASILAHETAHIIAAIAVGAHPSVAFDKGRPVVFSGIDPDAHPHKQFLFSASGLITQALINELILDVRHSRGSAFERGILAGGIGTTLFYITIGRNGSVSDIGMMERTSSLSKTQLSLIFGSVSAIHAWRISRDPSYGHFFVKPTGDGAAVGFSVMN